MKKAMEEIQGELKDWREDASVRFQRLAFSKLLKKLSLRTL
jgi:hypothetical protein